MGFSIFVLEFLCDVFLGTFTSYVRFILVYGTILSYVFFILSCTTLEVRIFVRQLYRTYSLRYLLPRIGSDLCATLSVLFRRSDANIPRPCSADAIGAGRRFPSPLESRWRRSCSCAPANVDFPPSRPPSHPHPIRVRPSHPAGGESISSYRPAHKNPVFSESEHSRKPDTDTILRFPLKGNPPTSLP